MNSILCNGDVLFSESYRDEKIRKTINIDIVPVSSSCDKNSNNYSNLFRFFHIFSFLLKKKLTVREK